MQQELGAREQTVAAMKAAGNVSTAALDELETTWDRVNNLSDIREAKLRDSLKMVGFALKTNTIDIFQNRILCLCFLISYLNFITVL